MEAKPIDGKVSTPDLTLETMETPGHGRDHAAFFEPERGWLFSGDAYLGERDILRSCEDLGLLLEDLGTLASLDAEVLFPGHGSVRDDPKSAIEHLQRHYEELRDRAEPLVSSGVDPGEIRSRLLGREGIIRYYTQGDFSKQNLVEELVGLLDADP